MLEYGLTDSFLEGMSGSHRYTPNVPGDHTCRIWPDCWNRGIGREEEERRLDLEVKRAKNRPRSEWPARWRFLVGCLALANFNDS